ncbi:MAG: UPF0175 family protein [Deltaproteobacteria bacterium]|nr:UPF0175 family protein [Deltaproteobacteria bacterium]
MAFVSVQIDLEDILLQEQNSEKQKQAIREGLIIRGYLNSRLSMGKVAEMLGLGYEEALNWLAHQGIDTWREMSPEMEKITKDNARKLAHRLNLKFPE